MTKLNQIVAIEKGEKASINRETAPLFHAAKSPAQFHGLTRTYEPVDEDGEQFPDESSRVAWTVDQLLKDFAKPSTRLLDVIATKEAANMKATADVQVDGETIVKDAPVTFLLQFEKYLSQEVRGLIIALPTLDPAQNWSESTTERAGISQSDEVKKGKQKKISEPLTLAPATDKHPAQVQLVSKDVLQGYWLEKKFSGAISGQRKQELIERVDKLINAVKFAREEANSITVTDKPVGAKVFKYLFA